jgi:hypothetical protein
MIPRWESAGNASVYGEQSPVARIPQVAVESNRRGVAVRTPRHDMARN